MAGRKGRAKNPKRSYSRLPFEQAGELKGAGVPPFPPELHQSGRLTAWQREMRTAWRDYHASSDRAVHDLAAGLLHDGGISPQSRWKPPNKEHHAELHRPYRITPGHDEGFMLGEVLGHLDAWARDQGYETDGNDHHVTIEVSGATELIIEPSDHVGLDTHKHLGQGALMGTIVSDGKIVGMPKHFNITSNYLKKVRSLVRRAVTANRALVFGSRGQQRRARKKARK